MSEIKWTRCIELGYADGPDSNDDMEPPICFACGSDTGKPPSSTTISDFRLAHVDIPLLFCSKCRVAGTLYFPSIFSSFILKNPIFIPPVQPTVLKNVN